MVAVVLLGAILLGVATLWDGGAPDAATDPVAARADIAQAADPSRPRHDAEEREVDGEPDRAPHRDRPRGTEGEPVRGHPGEPGPGEA
ncbi:hypothetical protein G5V59_08970 [Nocardioides sp. W3-2-3]|uniref:hypothetical protein n=1 Tax=Nocardioides convexus TaxID=2712224 RepID=UPI0024187C9C|nr:hypothetical protein [Nocardioides convexus]NHA00217.1 hypothetical protein [Nocardioides convexus]